MTADAIHDHLMAQEQEAERKRIRKEEVAGERAAKKARREVDEAVRVREQADRSALVEPFVALLKTYVAVVDDRLEAGHRLPTKKEMLELAAFEPSLTLRPTLSKEDMWAQVLAFLATPAAPV